MKKMLRISILLAFLGRYLFAGTSYQSAKEFFGREMPNEPTSIKVLLATDMKEIQLETHGRYRIYDPLKNIRIGYGFLEKNTLYYLLKKVYSGEKHFQIFIK